MSTRDDSIAKVDDASAWGEFCDLLKKAGDVLLREDLQLSTFERAEGHRYLGRLLRAGLLSFGENTGPRHPAFRTLPEMVKMGLDNPDNYYLSASVSGDLSYRLRGRRGSIHYLSFAAQNQNFAARDKITGGAGHLNDAELTLGPGGEFEIVASQVKPGPEVLGEAEWLKMAPDTKQILVRQTFLDRSSEAPATLDITCIEAEHEPKPPLDPENVPGMLLGSALYAMGCAQWFADWVIGFAEKAPENHFHEPDLEHHRQVGGDPNILFWLGRWNLGPDEALVIEAMPPNCDYWNFQIGNIWAESLDYHFHRTHVNSGGAAYRDDGSFELVVAHRDPDHPNWIDTAGHARGTMGLRWVRADSHPAPKTRVVKLSEL
jgi:hypothetical protein